MNALTGNPFGWNLLAAFSFGAGGYFLLPAKNAPRTGRTLNTGLNLTSTAVVSMLIACFWSGWRRALSPDALILFSLVSLLTFFALRFPRALGIPLVTLIPLGVLSLHIIFAEWTAPVIIQEAAPSPLLLSRDSMVERIFVVRARREGQSWAYAIESDHGSAVSIGNASRRITDSALFGIRIDRVIFHDFWGLVGLSKRYRCDIAENASSVPGGVPGSGRFPLALIGIRIESFDLTPRHFDDFEAIGIIARDGAPSWNGPAIE